LAFLDRIEKAIGELMIQVGIAEEFEDLMATPPDILADTSSAARQLIEEWRKERGKVTTDG
jgi:hypothetical protein